VRITARVPATAANLGPGFDCFALALDLCNEFTIDTEAEPGITWEGEGADELPIDGSDMVSRAMKKVGDSVGESFAPFHLHGVNQIPLERGLGSSSAAAVAGVALARAWLRLQDQVDHRELVFDAASTIEGHPDNAAAAAYGGLTVVADGRVRRFEVSAAITPVVLIPSIRLSTQQARAALTGSVPREDVVFNVAHGALVIHALVTGDLELLRLALRDRVHQAARLALIPRARALFEELDRSVPVCVSGAGPSLLAFPEPDVRLTDPGDGWRTLRLAVRSQGLEVLEA
jgi:homoserine kinase